VPLFGSKKKNEAKKIIKEGVILVKEMKYQEAIDLLSRMNLEQENLGNKISCGAWTALGMAYQGLRKYETALEYFERCLSVDKKRFEYLYGATFCAISLENWEKSKDYYYSLEVEFGDIKIVQQLAPYFYGLEQQQREKTN
jgi:tetratricopeptide (TPR) repeat protein